MVILVKPGDEEVILLDQNDKALIFHTKDEAIEFKVKNDLARISPYQRALISDLSEVEPCIYMTRIEPLPDFLASSHEIVSDQTIILDNRTGEILSEKYKIAYCDASSGFFVERIGGKLVAKDNQYKLHINHNMEIIK